MIFRTLLPVLGIEWELLLEPNTSPTICIPIDQIGQLTMAEIGRLVMDAADYASDYEDAHTRREKQLAQLRSREAVAEIAAEREREKRRGHIYLIHSSTLGLYKIGRTKNLKDRLKAYKHSPFDTDVLHTFPTTNMYLAEQQLLTKFASKARRGEWFTLDPEDVAWICALTTLEAGGSDEARAL